MPRHPTRPDESRASIEISEACYAARVRLVGRMVTRIYETALRPLGLTTAQMNILVLTSRLGEASAARICGILWLDPSTLSRNLERLQARGLITQRPGTDRRSRLLWVTRKGADTLAEALPLWRGAQSEVEKALGRATAVSVKAVGDRLLAEGFSREKTDD
ncbi:MAG: winged helix-turn-helix transcriptional regulator [Nitrospinae bacterium]|nr:winged helix-turn-helix transcriptional regulator [Nitrospinota bacterium]